MLKKLSLRFKLIFSFVFLASLVAGTTYYQLTVVNNAHELFQDLIENDVERLEAIQEISSGIDEIYSTTLLQKQGTSIKVSLSDLQAKLAAGQERYRSHLEKDSQESAIGLDQIDEIKLGSETLLEQAAELLSTPTNSSTFKTKELTFAQQREVVSKATGDILDNERQTIAEENKAADQQATQTSISALIAAALIVLAALALGTLTSGTIARRLAKLKVGAQRIANGDFSQRVTVEAHDELGTLATTFNQMSDRLRDSYRRLALEKQRDEALLESISEGLMAVDEQGQLVLMNNVAIELLELPIHDTLIGVSLYELGTLYTNEDKPLPREQHPAYVTLSTAQPAEDIFAFHRIDGKKILLNVSASPVVLEQRTVGAIILLRDVTKEKEVDRMKTEFISLASHQLRTPLSAIKWYTEMLISGDAGKLNPDQADFAQSIYESSERMISLVNSLLNISRIESGRIIVDPKPTNLQELVNGIIADLKAKTEERQQTLVVSVHKDLPEINLDPRLIGQVFMNLLTNAIKYTPKGGEISVFISKKDDQVISQVTDNGYGIPKDQQGKIFQKFFRAENIIKVETDGTGLGLYLIKAIIESSGGKIWFASEESKGTTFWFTLPLSGMQAKEGEVTLDA